MLLKLLVGNALVVAIAALLSLYIDFSVIGFGLGSIAGTALYHVDDWTELQEFAVFPWKLIVGILGLVSLGILIYFTDLWSGIPFCVGGGMGCVLWHIAHGIHTKNWY